MGILFLDYVSMLKKHFMYDLLVNLQALQQVAGRILNDTEEWSDLEESQWILNPIEEIEEALEEWQSEDTLET